jgi:hypothetical protein
VHPWIYSPSFLLSKLFFSSSIAPKAKPTMDDDISAYEAEIQEAGLDPGCV